jgi:hypothetical protein
MYPFLLFTQFRRGGGTEKRGHSDFPVGPSRNSFILQGKSGCPLMNEPHLPSLEEIESFASRVREASRSGTVLPFDGEEMLEIARSQGFDDLDLIREGGRLYAYSELHMTRRYAESAARAGAEDLLRAIVETVRSDSETYPRPTPVATFSEKPFLFAADQLNSALIALATDSHYADIQLVSASDGSRFLFSSRHLDAAHAASIAEWLAVGRFNNP